MDERDEARRALDDAKRFAEDGNYPAALERHLWFHEHALRIRPSMYGVRLSFAISYWLELGEKYPEALAALKAVRDETASRLRGGELKRSAFHDVASISEQLAETAITVELFRDLAARHPEFATKVRDLAEGALEEAGEHELSRRFLGDPMKRYEAIQERLGYGRKNAGEQLHPDLHRRAYESTFSSDVTRLLILLAATGDLALAKEIQRQALELQSSDSSIGTALLEHLER